MLRQNKGQSFDGKHLTRTQTRFRVLVIGRVNGATDSLIRPIVIRLLLPIGDPSKSSERTAVGVIMSQ